ncbi:NAD-dependent epimerase/dehydratase family protein [Microbaculum marinisediminis]|uniref:NAD(P)-dependent oxidoreductase n=1 Tax=Microbaculum marinisediminis TaxID=2931392 RepID=A0AAW5R188_9HYPH|nr:NAD(P)-dependent oxidoreductase [Microbaculum sp. A6E488]MCT8972927.1 NAD(P)-dependent oxidoreductase [Microbaculum sp. A6E488]
MTMPSLPSGFADEASLDDFMSTPTPELIEDLAKLEGDILILGAGGKMGPTVARMAKRAAPNKRVVAVARFSSPGLMDELAGYGVEPVVCDLLDREAVQALPKLENVIFMAGFKFGADSDPGMTWAMNVQVPTFVAEAFPGSRIVVFSTGCVYPFANVKEGGSTEEVVPNPPGEYAITCLGRERMFEYFSGLNGTPCLIYRLNYAIDLRYGVIHDIAQKIRNGEPIDVSMGHVNLIWQGDACAQALRCLLHCQSPAVPLNVSGPEIISVRWLAQELGRRMGKEPTFVGEESDFSWVTNTARAVQLFGYPHVSLMSMLDWVADWVASDRRSLGKPTKYEVRSGAY